MLWEGLRRRYLLDETWKEGVNEPFRIVQGKKEEAESGGNVEWAAIWVRGSEGSDVQAETWRRVKS